MKSIREAILETSKRLVAYSDSPRIDAEQLISAATAKNRTALFAYPDSPLNQQQRVILKNYIRQRQLGYPIAYIVGYKEFWSLDFMVTPDVLVPRPETECIVEWVLNQFSTKKKIRLLDLGTGSGAIAISIADARPKWEITAVDQSQKALNIAKQNAQKHDTNHIKFLHGNWCDPLPKNQQYNIIVSNPPYIAENDTHLPKLSKEPINALLAGHDGLSAIKKIIFQANSRLCNQGWLVLEHGYNQAEQVSALLHQQQYSCIQSHTDLAGILRITVAQKNTIALH